MSDTVSCPHVAHAHATFSFHGATVNLMTDTTDELLAGLAKFGVGALAVETPVAKPAGKPKAEKAAAAAASAEPAPLKEPAPDADAKASAAAETPKAKPVDYPTLQKAVFALAGAVTKKGLDTDEWVKSIAKKHGGATFKELAPDTYAAALADVTDQLAKVEAHEEAMA